MTPPARLVGSLGAASKFVARSILPEGQRSLLKAWLSGASNSNIAPLAYVGSANPLHVAGRDDPAQLWQRAHHSEAYYVTLDKEHTLSLVAGNINRRYENLIDFGVGGKSAVEKMLTIAKDVGATNYEGVDLSEPLATGAVLFARQKGFKATSHICNIFGELPFNKPNSLFAVLGLTIGNLEKYDDLDGIEHRLIGIFENYARAATAATSRLLTVKPKSGLLIDWDANMNSDEVKRCYDNPGIRELVRSCPGRFVDVSGFDGAVTCELMVSQKDPAKMVLSVAAGLQARETHRITYDGDEFFVRRDAFFPVIMSNRFNLPFMSDALKKGLGHAPRDTQVWSATQRVHYAHCHIDGPS